MSYVICGAKRRQGEGGCRNPAGARTDHLGSGRCWLHGGRSPRGPANGRWRHGIYARADSQTVRQLLEGLDADQELDTIADELLYAKARVAYWIREHNASWSLEELDLLTNMLTRLANMKQKDQALRLERGRLISSELFRAYLENVKHAAQDFIPDHHDRQRFFQRILEIPLEKHPQRQRRTLPTAAESLEIPIELARRRDLEDEEHNHEGPENRAG